MSGVWGPDGRRAAVSVTFDHLGEAAELQTGQLPADTVVGDHHSVTVELPRLLEMLEAHEHHVTFFVEAWNFDVYPDAVRSIVAAGHEIGWHGWLHEPWYQSSPEQIADALRLSLDAFERLGIRPRGARPPAGLLGGHSLDVLREAGFEYVSLAGSSFGTDDGMPLLSYPWHTVDGSYYIPGFTRLRRPPGDEVVSPVQMLDAYRGVVDETVEAGGCVAFVFHVPWQDDPERIDAIGTLIDTLRADERVWLASGGEIADWLRAHPEDFPKSGHRDEAPAW